MSNGKIIKLNPDAEKTPKFEKTPGFIEGSASANKRPAGGDGSAIHKESSQNDTINVDGLPIRQGGDNDQLRLAPPNKGNALNGGLREDAKIEENDFITDNPPTPPPRIPNKGLQEDMDKADQDFD